VTGQMGDWNGNGLLNLHKPSGVTSRDVVNQVVRLKWKRGLKVGHAGTLDPLASGVLVVCLGKATRLIEYVQRQPKQYRTTVRLGAVSPTLDADGEVTETEVPDSLPSLSEIQAAIRPLIGLVSQRPPEVSALRVNGQRAYDLVRAGKEVVLEPRLVQIDRIEILRYEWPLLDLEVDCGSGTYIRSIARDLGEALGCGGLVQVLERTKIGSFDLSSALDPAQLTRSTLPEVVLPTIEAVRGMPSLSISFEDVAAIVQGRPLRLDQFADDSMGEGEVALTDPEGELVAVAHVDPSVGAIQPRRVLVSA